VKKLEEAREKMKEMGAREINLTDNDARMQNDKGKIIAGYRLQVAVDSKEQVIVACDVTNSQEDSSELIPMVEKVLENVGVLERFFGFEVERIKTLFDSGYFNFWNFVKLLGDRYRKVDPYIPDQVHRARERLSSFMVGEKLRVQGFLVKMRKAIFPENNKRKTYPSLFVRITGPGREFENFILFN
jgi:hypothetical protein